MEEGLVFVYILTKNEEAAIGKLIDETRFALKSFDHRIVLIDDSSDRTSEIATQLGCAVIKNDNLGLGQAYSRALKEGSKAGADSVITMDGDGQSDPLEIPYYMEAAQRGGADLVLGSRFLKAGLIDYSYPWINRLGVLLLSKFLSFECRMKITDSHGGIRFHSRRCAESLLIRGRHTYVQESIIDAKYKGLAILEIPSRWRKREYGQSRVVGSVFRYIRKVLPVLLSKGKRTRSWVVSILIGLFAMSVLDF